MSGASTPPPAAIRATRRAPAEGRELEAPSRSREAEPAAVAHVETPAPSDAGRSVSRPDEPAGRPHLEAPAASGVRLGGSSSGPARQAGVAPNAVRSTALAAAEGVRDLDEGLDPELQRGLERVVRELGLTAHVASGRLALALVDVSDPAAPRLAMQNGHAMLYAASLPKLAILLGAAVEAERGRFPLDQEHLADITRMIRFSSNDAATRVLNGVGRERLLEILQSKELGLYDPRRNGGLWVGKAYGSEPPYRRDPLHGLSHGATAFQVARFYWLLESGRLAGPEGTALMREALSKPGINHKLVKGLESRPGASVLRKSGTWRDFHADSALVQHGAHKLIIVGLANHPDAERWLERLAAPLHDLIVPLDVHSLRR